jgi:hypothetical protein
VDYQQRNLQCSQTQSYNSSSTSSCDLRSSDLQLRQSVSLREDGKEKKSLKYSSNLNECRNSFFYFLVWSNDNFSFSGNSTSSNQTFKASDCVSSQHSPQHREFSQIQSHSLANSGISASLPPTTTPTTTTTTTTTTNVSGDLSSQTLKRSLNEISKPAKPFSVVARELISLERLQNVTSEDTTLKNCIARALESWQQTERLEGEVSINPHQQHF